MTAKLSQVYSKKMEIHVINLARRTDRWQALEIHAQAIGINLIKFQGSDAKDYPDIFYLKQREKSAIHCIISHKTLLEQCKSDSYVVVGEDDLRIQDLQKIKECLDEFKSSSFDICNLGFNPTWMPELGPINSGALQEVKSGPCLTAHMYAIKTSAIPNFFQALEFCGAQLLCGKLVYSHALDHAWSFPQFKLRVCVPKNIKNVDDMIVVQAGFSSDINV